MLLATSFALTSLPLPVKAVTYALDDGAIDDEVGIGVGSNGLLLNAFQTQTGGTTITSVDIAFSAATPSSTAFDIILFTDPNNDGNPADGLQAARETVSTPGSITPGAFVSYSFSMPPALNTGDWFFAGAVEPEPINLAIGIDADGGNSSWASFPGDALPGATVDTFATLRFPKDGMIRATGIPEPSTAGLALIGTASFLLRRRPNPRSN